MANELNGAGPRGAWLDRQTDKHLSLSTSTPPYETRSSTTLARDYALGAREPTAAAIRPRRFDLFPRPERLAVIIITGTNRRTGMRKRLSKPPRSIHLYRKDLRREIASTRLWIRKTGHGEVLLISVKGEDGRHHDEEARCAVHSASTCRRPSEDEMDDASFLYSTAELAYRYPIWKGNKSLLQDVA